MWQFAAFIQFLLTFEPALKIKDDLDTEVIEDALLHPEASLVLTQIAMSLLRNCCGLIVAKDNWEQFLRKILQDKATMDDITTDFDSFWQLSGKQRLLCLYQICELAFDDVERWKVKMKSAEDEENLWRVDPIGYDFKGNIYWLFDDNRMYRQTLPEDQRPKFKTRRRAGQQDNSDDQKQDAILSDVDPDIIEEDGSYWKPVCITLEDWTEFPKRFESSTHPRDKSFYKFLINDITPQVIPVLTEKKKKKELEFALQNRKRSTRLGSRFEEVEARKKEQEYYEEHPDEIPKSRTEIFMERRERNQKKREEEEKERKIREREERTLRREQAAALKRLKEEEVKKKEETVTQQTEQKKGKPQERSKKKRGGSKKQQQQGWMFDCYCGVSGENLDDGLPMVCCEVCKDWKHISCTEDRMRAEGKEVTPEWTSQGEYVCSNCEEEPSKKKPTKPAKPTPQPEHQNQSPTKISKQSTEIPTYAFQPNVYHPLQPQMIYRPQLVSYPMPPQQHLNNSQLMSLVQAAYLQRQQQATYPMVLPNQFAYIPPAMQDHAQHSNNSVQKTTVQHDADTKKGEN
ncbi:hypothetical protein MP638_006268 [Amoeboaphelidium occidentale]|nr:hypothetical protein MP638_006268 [Amoeboaphelidium occidentale]